MYISLLFNSLMQARSTISRKYCHWFYICCLIARTSECWVSLERTHELCCIGIVCESELWIMNRPTQNIAIVMAWYVHIVTSLLILTLQWISQATSLPIVDFTMDIHSQVITHEHLVIMSGHCHVIMINLHWSHWSPFGEHIHVYHIKIGHSIIMQHKVPAANIYLHICNTLCHITLYTLYNYSRFSLQF